MKVGDIVLFAGQPYEVCHVYTDRTIEVVHLNSYGARFRVRRCEVSSLKIGKSKVKIPTKDVKEFIQKYQSSRWCSNYSTRHNLTSVHSNSELF